MLILASSSPAHSKCIKSLPEFTSKSMGHLATCKIHEIPILGVHTYFNSELKKVYFYDISSFQMLITK